ncbi:sulfatase-like hydrolase/transferase [Amaricoccus sp.]|uniref:sulfatase-like hydrolase/transferase n=1 Tax=Amaricoccus sp. TaxID=1872485 RepID=UPI001B4A55D5|nr:sulfatase-like hydrolase/transferase [Amaricoccus sp.]MBP7002239.1 sulfatase-like hydrolase/transferase [Amaricoccus sp.]
MAATNLVYVSIDDMRAVDDWGRFADLVVTPNMDRLAAMGTTFERTVSQVPLCNPSRSSVLSGTQPNKTGVLDNQMPWTERIDAADTLPAVLKAAGAYVASFGKIFHTEVTIDAARQSVMFDEYLPGASVNGQRSNVVVDELYHDFPFNSGRYRGNDLQDERNVAAAVDFLENRAGDLDAPFFLAVGISKPHLSWWVPGRYFDLYDPAAIRTALTRSLQDGTIIPGNGEYFDVPPMSVPSPEHAGIAADIDLWADYIHAYLASVSYADAKLGQVLDALEADPALAADTAILMWSDHGYHLGDKDRWGKFTHWRESTEVPFILVDPDQPGGRTARQVVSLVDLFPTVLDMMGIDAPARLELDGDSLMPIMSNPRTSWYDPASGRGVALTTIDGSVSVRAAVPGVGDIRYTIYPDGTEELYDIGRDPNEHVNRVDYATGEGLTAADDALRATMRGLMDQQLAEHDYLRSDGVNPVRGTAADELIIGANLETGRDDLGGRGGDDVYVIYRDARIVETAGGGDDLVIIRDEVLERSFQLPQNVESVQVRVGFTGGGRASTIIGSELANDLRGGGGADVLLGLAGADMLFGDGGRDTLRGSYADDRLTGGGGADTLEGGSGNDVFVYLAGRDSRPADADVILGFDGRGSAAGDLIDLSALDADTRVDGNQAFRFGGTGGGRIRLIDNAAGETEVLANVDGDPDVEFRIVIRDGSAPASAYTAADFAL